MSGYRFTAWQLYEVVEPFGERAHYWRAGQICAAYFNANRTKKTDYVHTAEDFMPRTFDSTESNPPVDEFAQLKALQEKVRRKT